MYVNDRHSSWTPGVFHFEVNNVVADAHTLNDKIDFILRFVWVATSIGEADEMGFVSIPRE
jgi:hypothetical protein